MEEMRLYNEPTEATLDQTIALNSVIQPRAHADAGAHAKHANADQSAASMPRMTLLLFNPKRPKSIVSLSDSKGQPHGKLGGGGRGFAGISAFATRQKTPLRGSGRSSG